MWKRSGLLVLMCCLLGCGSGVVPSRMTNDSSEPAANTHQQASRAYDFAESVGLNTHFGYTDTGYYQRPAEVIAAIQALHIHHVRDGLAYTWVAPHLYSIYEEVAAAGIHPDLVMPNPGVNGPTAAKIEELLSHYPGVDAIEGANEFDNNKDAGWSAQLLAYLPDIWQVSEDTGIPVIGPSLTKTSSYPALGVVSGYMSYNNLHAYWGGRNPETGGWGGVDAEGHSYGSFAYDLDQLDIDGPNRSVMTTETGYVASDTPKMNVISEAVEAVYEPRLLLHSWNVGIKRTYVYELMDEPSSTTGFGLMRRDLSPRAAYTALKSLMELIDDEPNSNVPEELDYNVTGATPGVETVLLQKQDGSFWLALWLQGSIYDVNALKATTLTSQSVQVSLNGGKAVQHIWSFDSSGNVTDQVCGLSSVSVSVGSTVTLLKIS